MTIYTAVIEPREYPGRVAGGPAPDLAGQSFSPLSGRRSEGRRADGRAFAVGDEGGLLHYAIAWPYRCVPADLCPEAGPFRVIRMEVEGTDGREGPAMRTLTRELIETIRPITNALPPTGRAVAEEPGLFADAPVVVGRGGQGDYAWEIQARKGSGQDYWIDTLNQDGDLFIGEVFTRPARDEVVAYIHCAPSRERATAMLVTGIGSEAVAKVELELKGQPSVEVATFRDKRFPFTFWVVAPLPPEARPESFTSFDAAGAADRQGDLVRRLPELHPLTRARWPNRAWST
jgi:hypothetical protein